MIGERELAPDHVLIAAVFALPERIADDQTRLTAARLIVRVREDAAPCSFHAQRIKEIPAGIEKSRRAHLSAWSEVTLSAPQAKRPEKPCW